MTDEFRFHKRVEKLVCNWSMMMGHAFTEEELNSLVDLIGDDLKREADAAARSSSPTQQPPDSSEGERCDPCKPGNDCKEQGGDNCDMKWTTTTSQAKAVCSECDGKQLVYVQKKYRKCNHCNGTGWAGT